jgi:hypothetical protein
MDLIRVTDENIHTILPKYIEDNNITITEIDDIIETYMDMVKNKHLFLIDRDLLKDLLVDITYMCNPQDDANKSRVLYHLVGSDSEDEDDDSCEEIDVSKITNTD